ncbi:hypothetical protein [Brevifollis gellanilyticus]|uniref:Uncharacterized protein n=1 Tax=Brevifollis gellanilyticus TaxID=748831 RepID=A0A512MI83_9BACT|nr:hypothetical protein [Brevifollis gellanilyticus]GEP46031.1 hypothetical protein BGE01nite_53220 [Brevifollis gellanilyticus]
MNHYPAEADWRATHIPCRIIERLYGNNMDDAGDDVGEALQSVSGGQGPYRYRFSFDTSHVNPWYHVMVFEIENVPDSVHQEFLAKLRELGLLER